MNNYSKHIAIKLEHAQKNVATDLERKLDISSKLAVSDNAETILKDNDKASLRDVTDSIGFLCLFMMILLLALCHPAIILGGTVFIKIGFCILFALTTAATTGSIMLRLGLFRWYANMRSAIKLRKSPWTRRDVLHAMENNDWSNPCVERLLTAPQQYRVLTESELVDMQQQVEEWNHSQCSKAWHTMLERKGAPIRQRDIDHLLDIKCLAEQEQALKETEITLQKALNIYKARTDDKKSQSQKSSATPSSDIAPDPQQAVRTNLLQSSARIDVLTIMDDDGAAPAERRTTSHTHL